MTDPDMPIRSVVDHDGAVILDLRSDAFYGTNGTGAYIWSRLVHGDSVDEIARALAAETGTDLELVFSDLAAFLADLKSKRLLPLADQRPREMPGVLK